MEAEDAVEAAAYQLLNVPAMTALAPVFQHVPQETPPPVLIIGPMDSSPLGVKGSDPDALVNVTLIAVVSGEERKPVRVIGAMARELLDDVTVEAEGFSVTFTFDASDGEYEAEAGAYIGNFRFSAMALKQ